MKSWVVLNNGSEDFHCVIHYLNKERGVELNTKKDNQFYGLDYGYLLITPNPRKDSTILSIEEFKQLFL